MKCAVMRAHMLKLRFIGKSKIRFPTSPVPLRSVMGPSTFWCIVKLYRPRGTSAYSRMHAITRADSRKTRGIISPRVKISLFFARAYSLSSCVEKSIERWKTCGNAPVKPLIYWRFNNRTVLLLVEIRFLNGDSCGYDKHTRTLCI